MFFYFIQNLLLCGKGQLLISLIADAARHCDQCKAAKKSYHFSSCARVERTACFQNDKVTGSLSLMACGRAILHLLFI